MMGRGEQITERKQQGYGVSAGETMPEKPITVGGQPTDLELDVKVDGERDDLSGDVPEPELLDEIAIFQRQTLGDLHGSEGEDEVGDLRRRRCVTRESVRVGPGKVEVWGSLRRGSS